MVMYNLLTSIYLSYIGIRGQWVGDLLWPAVTIHGLLTLLLVRSWFRDETDAGSCIAAMRLAPFRRAMAFLFVPKNQREKRIRLEGPIRCAKFSKSMPQIAMAPATLTPTCSASSRDC